jgi:hypothetical protein
LSLVGPVVRRVQAFSPDSRPIVVSALGAYLIALSDFSEITARSMCLCLRGLYDLLSKIGKSCSRGSGQVSVQAKFCEPEPGREP